MQKITPGTPRWIEIEEMARALSQRQELTYVRLKEEARCSSDVASRVLEHLSAQPNEQTVADDTASGAAAVSDADALPPRFEAQWVDAVARLKRVANLCSREAEAHAAASREGELQRLRELERELQGDRSALLKDLRAANSATEEADTRAESLADELTVARRETEEAKKRLTQLEGEIVRLRAEVGDLCAQLTKAGEALAAAKAVEAECAARADQVRVEVDRLRDALLEARTTSSRLEGELAASTRAHSDLRSLFEATRALRPRRAALRAVPVAPTE